MSDIKQKIINKIADTRYEPTETTMPGAIHTYGQIPGLNALLSDMLDLAIAEERKRIVEEIEKYKQKCILLQKKAIENGNSSSEETWGDRWCGANEVNKFITNTNK